MYSVWETCQWGEVVQLEEGGIVMVVESGSEDWPLESSGKAKVTELGAGRDNEGRWDVLVRGMFVDG